jgi:hypothetical protein
MLSKILKSFIFTLALPITSVFSFENQKDFSEISNHELEEIDFITKYEFIIPHSLVARSRFNNSSNNINLNDIQIQNINSSILKPQVNITNDDDLELFTEVLNRVSDKMPVGMNASRAASIFIVVD